MVMEKDRRGRQRQNTNDAKQREKNDERKRNVGGLSEVSRFSRDTRWKYSTFARPKQHKREDVVLNMIGDLLPEENAACRVANDIVNSLNI